MLRFFLRWASAACSILVAANATPLSAQINGVEVEAVISHDGPVGNSDLTGMTTYRIYASVTSSTDFVGAVYGSAPEEIHISSTTSFFQHPAGGSFGTDLNAFFLGILPDLNYDSWLTIGLDLAPSDVDEEGISSIGLTSELAAFETGADFVLNSEVGGSWFVLPGSTNGYPDGNLRVLLAQVTTGGLLSGELNLQCFIAGNPFDEQLVTYEFGAGAPGCIDSEACNYDPEANSDDGSCSFAEEGYGCDGTCLLDTDGDGICDPFEVAGCEDPLSCNYAVGVTDAEECMYAVEGYDCFGTCILDADEDGVCDAFEVPGCSDIEACNFDASATDEDGTCEYPALYFDCNAECIQDSDGDGVCDELEFPGCTNEEADNYFPAATDDDGSCFFSGCMDMAACNYNSMADTPTDCTYPEPGYDCDGVCLEDVDADGVCDSFEVLGCTNPLAENFNTEATDDNGLCLVLPPSYCGEGTTWDDVSGQCISDGTGEGSGNGGVGGYGGECFGDFDADGERGTADLLMWLAVYGSSCE